MQQGAAQPHIYPSDLMRLDMPLPTIEVWGQLEKLLANLYDNLRENKNQINILAKLRDTLLPKLISGELRVPQLVKEARA